MNEKNKHAVALGKIGGSKTSKQKARAARQNGKAGGRPKKKIKVSRSGMQKTLTSKGTVRKTLCFMEVLGRSKNSSCSQQKVAKKRD